MLRTFIALALALFIPALSHAQTDAPSLKLPTIVFGAAATADWVTTHRLLTQCAPPTCWETNPTLKWAETRPTVLVATGTAMDVLGVWAWNRYVGRRHPRIATVGLYAMSALRVWLAVRNHRLLTRSCGQPVGC